MSLRFSLRKFRSFREGEPVTIKCTGRYYILPHYMVKWGQIKHTKAAQTSTPLLNL
jgi:hypothetical protein